VTVATINAVVSSMMLVAELHRLLALCKRARVPRRAIDGDGYPEQGEHDKDRSEDTEPGQEISAVMKNLGHRSCALKVLTFQRTGKSQRQRKDFLRGTLFVMRQTTAQRSGLWSQSSSGETHVP
jgi:hypothetical protein